MYSHGGTESTEETKFLKDFPRFSGLKAFPVFPVPPCESGFDSVSNVNKGATMSPETRTKLKNTLADHGLTVLQTKDHTAMLQELARLAQFERLMLTTAAGNPPVETAVEHVILSQLQSAGTPVPDAFTGAMEIDDIPRVMREAHAGLHSYHRRQVELLDPKTAPDIIEGALEISRVGRDLNNLGYLRTGLINAAVAALVGVISIDRSREVQP